MVLFQKIEKFIKITSGKMDNRKNEGSKADYYSSKENFRDDDELIDDDLENDPLNNLSEYEIEKLENASDEQLLQLEIDQYNLDLLEKKLGIISDWVAIYSSNASKEFSFWFWVEFATRFYGFIIWLVCVFFFAFFVYIILEYFELYEWVINLLP